MTDEFWNAIDLANEDFDKFILLIKDMNKGELIRFYWGYQEASLEIMDDPWYGIIQSMEFMPSEDGLRDLCDWIVEQGEEFYTRIRENPENLRTIENLYVSPSKSLEEAVCEYLARYNESPPQLS